MADYKELGKWLQNSVNFFKKNPDYSSARYNLDEQLCVVMGWAPGFYEEDEDGIHYPDDPSYELCVKIAVYNPSEWDFEFFDMPSTGNIYDDVWNTEHTISNGSLSYYNNMAQWLLSEWEDMKKYGITDPRDGTPIYDAELDEACDKKSSKKNKRAKKESVNTDWYTTFLVYDKNENVIGEFDTKQKAIDFAENNRDTVYYVLEVKWLDEYDEDGYVTDYDSEVIGIVWDSGNLDESCGKKSRRKNKRTKKESKYLKEGPGAGYTIKGSAYIEQAHDVKIDYNSIQETKGLYGNEDYTYVVFSCSAILDVQMKELSFYSYMYGSQVKNVDMSIQANDITFEFAYEDRNDIQSKEDITPEKVADLLNECSFEFDYTYGGGWSHSTYDGTIADVDNSIYIDYYDDIVMIDGRILDDAIVDFIDKSVSGELIWSNYAVWNEEGEEVNSFSDEDEAIEWAKANDGVKVTKDEWEEIDFYGSVDLLDTEIIWERDYDKSYRYESRRAKTRKTEKNANRLSDKEIYDILGFDTDWVNESEENKEIVRDCLRDFRELNKTYPENSIWLKSDVGVYTKGEIIDELGDLAVVQ